MPALLGPHRKNNYCLLFHVSASETSFPLPDSLHSSPPLQLAQTDYHLGDLMKGISLAMAGNAPDDSRACDEDLETLADVMLSDTCMHSQA